MMKLQAQNLAKKFINVLVFRDVTIEAENGIIGISGPNGSGKSTLLKCLTYLLRPSLGSVVWSDGEQRLSVQEFRSRIGYAAPYINLYSELSCIENLRFILRLRNIERGDHELIDLLGRVGLSKLIDQPFGLLSSGQQQRLRLASALLPDPEVLVLDEPGTNLDQVGESLVKSITEEWRAGGRLLFLASNDAAELEWCDEVINVSQKPKPRQSFSTSK